jgi:hypothetical protein
MPTLNAPIQTNLKVLLETDGLMSSVERVLRDLGGDARSLEALADSIASLEGGEEFAPVIAGLIRLAAGSVSREKTLDEFMQAVAGTKRFSEAEREELRRFFQTVFSLPVVDGVAAFGQVIELERPFSGASVITDIRPIVSPGPEPRVSSFALVHQLRIRYEQVNGFGETYVALTSKELKTLYGQIEAAVKKEETIRATLQGGALGAEISAGEE